jgi:hypothetical protein
VRQLVIDRAKAGEYVKKIRIESNIIYEIKKLNGMDAIELC